MQNYDKEIITPGVKSWKSPAKLAFWCKELKVLIVKNIRCNKLLKMVYGPIAKQIWLWEEGHTVSHRGILYDSSLIPFKFLFQATEQDQT